MTRISEHVRHAVICKMQEHTNIKKVAKDLHLCRSTVRSIWKKFLETGSISDKKKSGRPPLLSESGRRNLSMLAFNLLQGSTCYPKMSRSSIQRYLRKPGLLGRIAAKKPMLTKQHMKRRRLWCKAYSSFMEVIWSKVIFPTNLKFRNTACIAGMSGDQ